MRPASAHLGRHSHVVPHRERPESLQPLKGARETQPGELIRPSTGHVGAIEDNPPRVRLLEACRDVEKCRLAGSVRPDEAVDRSVR